ncbi:hypothetical protein KSP39_PZI015709 [Platanthera zijinensis]|uniref:Uncharacterized protein n=1 Tax=Platanthera zijinensis TaxID=2320716 RepID=A0AAP0B923_9ASPA
MLSGLILVTFVSSKSSRNVYIMCLGLLQLYWDQEVDKYLIVIQHSSFLAQTYPSNV